MANKVHNHQSSGSKSREQQDSRLSNYYQPQKKTKQGKLASLSLLTPGGQEHSPVT